MSSEQTTGQTEVVEQQSNPKKNIKIKDYEKLYCEEKKKNDILGTKLEQKNNELDELKLEMKKLSKCSLEKLPYGEIARSNGIQYEEEVRKIMNDSISVLQKVNKHFTINLDNSRIELISNKQVDSIIQGEKTTIKSDIIIHNNGISHGISVKMTNTGTQFHAGPLHYFLEYLSYKNISCNDDVIKVWKKFLGIIVPNDDELKKLNINREDKRKNSKRYWLNELSKMEQLTIELFISINRYALLEFCLRNGMCLEQPNQAEFFLFNTESYTETKNINFVILNFDDLLQKINVGKAMITKDGSLQLSKYVGIQRKGSGGLSQKNTFNLKIEVLIIYLKIYHKIYIIYIIKKR